MYDIIIIGSGPAGLTAAIYASRAQLTAVVLEKDYLGSGQIAVSEQIDNYPAASLSMTLEVRSEDTELNVSSMISSSVVAVDSMPPVSG